MYQQLLKPLLFSLPPERAHALAVSSLEAATSVPPLHHLLPDCAPCANDALEVHAFGLRFRNPVGLAAGFDKNARHALALERLGFGFIEVGSITARSTPGNPRPRLFRLPSEHALINRMGLGNEGAARIAPRLAHVRERIGVPIFANVALTPNRTKNAEEAIADYVESARLVCPSADALVLNVSCPNSGDGRTFEDASLLDRLLREVVDATSDTPLPRLVKLSTDLDAGAFEESLEVVAAGADGLVLANTTTARDMLRVPADRLAEIGMGGLSGRPLRGRALTAVSRAAKRLGDRCPIVGVGGIASGDDARTFLEAGATLVQLYTGLVYEGPGLVASICRSLGRRERGRERHAATAPHRTG